MCRFLVHNYMYTFRAPINAQMPLLHTRFKKDELNLCLEGPMGRTKEKGVIWNAILKKRARLYFF